MPQRAQRAERGDSKNPDRHDQSTQASLGIDAPRQGDAEHRCTYCSDAQRGRAASRDTATARTLEAQVLDLRRAPATSADRAASRWSSPARTQMAVRRRPLSSTTPERRHMRDQPRYSASSVFLVEDCHDHVLHYSVRYRVAPILADQRASAGRVNTA